jgi:HK97 family phage prohead protease
MKTQRIAFDSVEWRAETREADSAMVLTGYAAVFDKPAMIGNYFREVIRPGAFTNAIQNDDVRALWNHDSNIVLGRTKSGTLQMTQDETGLRVSITLPDSNEGRDKFASVARGDVDGMSFGFRVPAGGERWSFDADGIELRELTNLSVFDVSPVAYPAYQETEIEARSVLDAARANGLIKEAEVFGTPLSTAIRRQELIEIGV